MPGCLETWPGYLIVYGLTFLLVFVAYSIPVFARSYSIPFFSIDVPASTVAIVSGGWGLINGTIVGTLIYTFGSDSVLLSCFFSLASTVILVSLTLVGIWFRDRDRPSGEFGEYYFGWLLLSFVLSIIPCVLSGLLAAILISTQAGIGREF